MAFLILCLGSQYLLVWGVASGVLPGNFYNLRIFGPLGSALAVFWWMGGWPAVGKLLAPLLKWRCHWQWYVFVLVWLTLFSMALLVLENLVMGRGWAPIPLDFSNANPFQDDPAQAAVARSILRGSVMTAVVEEVAWVSCCMMLLTRYFTWLVAGLVTSVFWCSWWVPVILFGDGVIPGLPVPVLFVHYMGLAATCMWVYYYTRSALLVIVMQFITNMVSLIIPVLPDSGGSGTYLVYVFSKCALILVLFMKFGPKPLWRKSAPVHPHGQEAIPSPAA